MLKIGEFSKLSLLSVKTLRFYEEEGLLKPAFVDSWTGYRYYETSQLFEAAQIKAYRQLGLSIGQTKAILSGEDKRAILEQKVQELESERDMIERRLTIIRNMKEETGMDYQATVKTVPACIVYTSETHLESIADIMTWIPAQGAACAALNPGLKCSEPAYEFVEYLDGEYRTENVHIRHSEAVEARGNESDQITFREIPETKVLSIYHQGPYETLGKAYAFIAKYAEQNGYEIAGYARECYIDGIWNKDDPADWLTEIQMPIA